MRGRLGRRISIVIFPCFGGSPAFCVDQAARRTRRRRRSKLARPYMVRFSSLRRVIWPSACPLLHGVVSAARTTVPSCFSPSVKVSRGQHKRSLAGVGGAAGHPYGCHRRGDATRPQRARTGGRGPGAVAAHPGARHHAYTDTDAARGRRSPPQSSTQSAPVGPSLASACFCRCTSRASRASLSPPSTRYWLTLSATGECRATIQVERLSSRAAKSVKVTSAGRAGIAVTVVAGLRVQVVEPQA
jgi:hypothetical protein